MDKIEKGNRLMIKFLKWDEGYPHETDGYGYIQVLEGFITPFYNYRFHEDDDTRCEWTIDNLRFHKSWDWLMLVIQKISERGDEISSETLLKLRNNIPDIKITWETIYRFLQSL